MTNTDTTPRPDAAPAMLSGEQLGKLLEHLELLELTSTPLNRKVTPTASYRIQQHIDTQSDTIARLEEELRVAEWWRNRYYLALDDIAADDMDAGDMGFTARGALEYDDSFDDDTAAQPAPGSEDGGGE